MYATLHKEGPDRDADNAVQQQVPHANAEHQVDKHQESNASAKGCKVDSIAAGVTDSNHKNRADVIGNGKGQDHHTQCVWNLLAKDRHATHHEGDIRGCRNTPTAGGADFATGTKRQINQRREQHTASRRNNRKARRLRVMQFTIGHLPLHL